VPGGVAALLLLLLAAALKRLRRRPPRVAAPPAGGLPATLAVGISTHGAHAGAASTTPLTGAQVRIGMRAAPLPAEMAEAAAPLAEDRLSVRMLSSTASGADQPVLAGEPLAGAGRLAVVISGAEPTLDFDPQAELLKR
jgi:hypothetical protein